MGRPKKEQIVEQIMDFVAVNNPDGTKSPRAICIMGKNSQPIKLDIKNDIPVPELTLLLAEIATDDGWDTVFELTKEGQGYLLMRDDYRVYLGLTNDGEMYRNCPTKEGNGHINSVGGRVAHSQAVYFRGERHN